MTVRVTLISPATNAGLREARFGGDGPLDPEGERRARAAALALPSDAAHRCGLSGRCRATAAALGLEAVPEPALREWEMGRWTGLRLSEVTEADPAGVEVWLRDPDAQPHGGESLNGLVARVGGWLDRTDPADGPFVAVAEPAVVRAAVVHALRLPPETFWRLDVAPLTATRLVGRAGRWNLTIGHPWA
ncbi:histidine phosphatase family protein [uncultured Streptomyces sp.]|uniref:histidine phosphatase family protein n=1 Tax=uncultured Streptomyces sp. TaxID=174707 RepID=UPI00262ECCB0|nr:histidine phosphatase family protein [uncultured Streptomyces sp.]